MTQCDPTDRSKRPVHPIEITILSSNEDIDAVLARKDKRMKPTDQTLAALQLTVHCMAQEAAFGLTITFPEEVKHLSDKQIRDLTEEEAQILIDAGRKAHYEALAASVQPSGESMGRAVYLAGDGAEKAIDGL